MLTNNDLKQILDALARYGKKDSQLDTVPIDLEHPEGTFTTNDYLSIVQDGKNKTIKIKNLEKVFLLTFLTDEDFREALKGRIPGEMLENASVTTEKLADGSITTIKLGDSSVTNAKLSDNAVTSAKLADNSVTTDKIVDGSVTTSKLNTNAVTTDKLANSSVTTDKIANGAVTSSKIADNSLSGANFGNNTIEGTKIKDNSIPGSKLADGAIESIDIKDGTLSGSKLADNSVTGAKLQDSVITGMKIADNSIPGSKIADSTIQNLNIANGSISGSKLVDNAITTDKIANGAINSAKLTNDAITENKIADDSVTTNKIADRAVTNSKLANNSVTSDKIADNSITSNMITDYAVTENKLDSGSVTASKIAPNAVTTTKLGDNVITSDKIVDGSVTEQKLADNSVTTDKIDTDAVTNVNIADNAVTESKIATNAVTTTKIVDSSVTTVKIADNTVTTIKLADGAVTEDKLADGAVTTAKLANGLISEIQNITDATPTEGSVKPIQSGGVQVALMNRAIVGDIVGDPAQAWEPGTAEAYIDQKIAEQNAVLNAKMSRQDAVIHALNGQDIVLVSALPQTGEANKIYRLTGTDSYTDYMWDTSLATPAFTDIATYSFPGIDDKPVAGSEKLVKSGGVQNELALGAVYDVSAKNPTAGSNNDGKWESLSALLSDVNLNTLIPTSVRKGGMSIKFVQSSDNKYVQYFLTKNQWSAREADWQKMNLEKEVSQLDQEVASMQNTLPIIPDKSVKTFVGWYDAYSGGKREQSYNNYRSTDKFSFAYYDYFVREILNGLRGTSANNFFHIYFWKNNVYKGYENYSPTLSSWQIFNPSQQQVSSLEDLGDIDIFAITISTTYIPLSKLRSPIYQYFDEFVVADPNVELGLQYLKYGFEFEWLPGFRSYTSGNYSEYNVFRTTSTPFPKALAPLLYKAKIEDIGYSTSYVDSYYSLYKDGVYVGSYGRHSINKEIVICYWDTNQHVVDNIEYDSFYITFYKSQNPNYLNNIKVPPYLSMIEEQEWNKIEKAFYALGDSITQGAFADNVSYADWLNDEILFDSFTKLAISGCSCMKNATHPTLYLHKEVESLPSNADGIISVMIGVNDISVQNPLGSVAEAMALDYSQLDDETTFANAFRYNMEGIQRKCPNAILLCLLPIKTKVTVSYPYVSEENMNALRDIEKGICYALGIPFIETQLAGFSQYYNWSTFMNDSVHPIEAGHKKIAQFLKGKFLQYK